VAIKAEWSTLSMSITPNEVPRSTNPKARNHRSTERQGHAPQRDAPPCRTLAEELGVVLVRTNPTMKQITLTPRRTPRFGPPLPIRILIGFLIAITAIVIVARLSYGALKDTVGGAQRVADTLVVIEQLEAILSTMKDAETGQRGFMLTGDENYIAPYMHAKAMLAGQIATAHALVADDPEQQRRLQGLEQVCADKMAELAQTIAIRRKADLSDVLAIVRTNHGAELMERIRTITAQMAAKERRILAAHQAERLGEWHVSLSVIVGGAAFLLIYILAVAFRTSRDYRERRIRIWVRTGQIVLSERLQGDQRLEKLADRALGFLADYLDVQAGAIYVAEPDGRFRRFAGYAVAGGPELDVMRPGDGLLGQAAKENRALHLKEVPEGYLSAGSSPGWSKPIELFVAPASVDGVVHAVIELIFSRRLEAADHTLLVPAFESIGAAVRSSTDRRRLEEVLEAAQRQGEELARTNLQLEQLALVLKRQKDDLSMFNSANFSSIMTDAKGVIQIFNVGAERMLGFTAEEVVNRVTPADLSDPQEIIARAKALSVELETQIAPGFEALVFKAARCIEDIYELTYIRKDGSRFPAVVSVTALYDAEDAIIGYLLIGTDNSARKHAEETLLKAGALQRAIFNSTNFSSIATDAKGVIQIFNVGAERMLGYTAEEVMNKITPADISDSQEIIARAKALSVELETQIAPGFDALVFKASRGIEDIYELTYIRKDGSRFPAVVSVTALRDAEGAIIGYLLIGTDNTARKRAEEELLKAGALQRAIFNSANFSKIATDSNGVIQIFNVGAERMLGYTAEEVVNKITPADISDPLEIVARAKTLSLELETQIAPGFEALVFKASRGIEDIYELTYIRKDGSRFPAVVSVTALRDAEGAIIGYLLIGTDNTARKRAEEALVKAGALQSAIFNSANFSSIATDSKGVIQIFNVGAERMLGYTAEEVVNKITPADISDPQEIIARAEALSVELETPIAPGFDALVFKASRGIEDIYELTYIRKDGSRFPAVVSVTALRDAEGAIIGYLLIGTDNTARKQIEAEQAQLGQRLRDHQFYTRSLFESNIDALMTTDAPGIITDVNKQMEALTGCTRDELIGAPFKNFFTDPERAEAGISLALSKRKVTDYELTACDREGKQTVVSYNATTLYDRDRRLQGVFAAVREITERKQYERSLREATHRAEHANSAKSEFLANMSHEIRTPLNAIIGLGYLLEHTTLNEDQRQLLSKIQFGGRALLGVINNVLDLSKIEAGEMSLEDEPFDLPELVRDLGQMLAPQAVAKGIELVVQCAPTMPHMVRGDASRLRQILTNLLGNSIKFTESGHVELKVFCIEQNSDRIRLRCTVQDTGIGIAPAALERLFAPFTQADASTTRRFGGTGLGLSIARRFVELLGGEIGVSSTVSVGSTFWIEMPLQIAHDIDGTLNAHGLRILVVDSGGDAPERPLAMARALGWSPKVAENGEQLLAAMSSAQSSTWPDVLILELHLHDMDAHQLIARLEKECAHGELPPVIVVADLAQSYIDHQQLMRTSDIMLVRPLTSSALFNAVNTAVSKQPDSLERVLQCTNFHELRAQWLAGVRVLVVDDSDINLEVAQRILEKQGATVTTCSDGLAALEHVRVHHQILDVVLMDVQMPTLDGNEATRRIRGELQLSALPIVALTAGALVGERQRALEAGMNDFISKPFDPQALIRKVRRLVEQARGEPIAMVILDAEPTRQATDRPLMPSIDAGVVQQMFGDDLPLFKSLLARMLREFSDLALPTSVPPDDQTIRSEMKARTHKLKGSAGMIGATKVMRLAGAAEVALQEDRAADVVEGILGQLASALITLREESAPLLERQEPDTAAVAEAVKCPNLGNADIEELCALLESQNLAAIDRFGLLSPSLSERVGAVRFDRLRDAIDNLEFQLGAELLRETLQVGRPKETVKARQAGLSQQ
jgi:PAS domain S-box-containing protein